VIMALATTGPSVYWYLARGTGAVALVLLTISVVLGILGSLRFAVAPRWPRFAIDTLHRDVSLLVIVLLVVHIITSVLDSFAPIKLTDSVIPFVSSYRPLWLGLGALAFDILLALVVTSLVRRRLGYGRWRLVHWLAYASWPVAVLHGLGTGTDTKVWWMLALTAACVAAVTVATLVRISRTDGVPEGLRAPAATAAVIAPIAIAIFALVGPLQTGWARRAGTPARLLAAHVSAPAATARPVSNTTRTLRLPVSATLAGSVNQSPAQGGTIVDLGMNVTGGAHGRLRIRLAGSPLPNGGLSLTGSQVDLLLNGLPNVLAGKVTFLEGQEVVAHVSDGSGTALDLHVRLNVNGNQGTVTGTMHARAAGGGG
jgi:methionine sulfoxide reductase heme-binding subunit